MFLSPSLSLFIPCVSFVLCQTLVLSRYGFGSGAVCASPALYLSYILYPGYMLTSIDAVGSETLLSWQTSQLNATMQEVETLNIKVGELLTWVKALLQDVGFFTKYLLIVLYFVLIVYTCNYVYLYPCLLCEKVCCQISFLYINYLRPAPYMVCVCFYLNTASSSAHWLPQVTYCPWFCHWVPPYMWQH